MLAYLFGLHQNCKPVLCNSAMRWGFLFLNKPKNLDPSSKTDLIFGIVLEQKICTTMTCNFTSFSTVFQSYQDDVWVKKKGCVQRLKRFSPPAGLELRTARSAGQSLKKLSFRGSIYGVVLEGQIHVLYQNKYGNAKNVKCGEARLMPEVRPGELKCSTRPAFSTRV